MRIRLVFFPEEGPAIALVALVQGRDMVVLQVALEDAPRAFAIVVLPTEEAMILLR